MTVEILRLAASDLGAMRELNALFGREFGDPQSYEAAPPTDAWLSDVLAKDHVFALVAREGAVVVGGLVAYQLDKLEQARSEIYIYDLAVAATHRRRGIATSLVERLKRLGAERGVWVVYVQADHGDDPAVALYSKLGVREDVMHFDIETPKPR